MCRGGILRGHCCRLGIRSSYTQTRHDQYTQAVFDTGAQGGDLRAVLLRLYLVGIFDGRAGILPHAPRSRSFNHSDGYADDLPDRRRMDCLVVHPQEGDLAIARNDPLQVLVSHQGRHTFLARSGGIL